MKGATAYEFEGLGLYLRITHLEGAYWKYKPWRRFSIRWIGFTK